MTKFQAGDRATPITTESHKHISKGRFYTILSVDRHFVEITDDIGVTSWWSKDWFTKIEGVKLDTAESLRDSYKALQASLVSLQQQTSQLESEKTKVVEQLKEMGFALIPSTPEQQIAVSVQDIEDYSNPTKWKVGYCVKCTNDQGWHGEFVSGGNYKITYVDSQNIVVKGEREDVNIRWDCRDFEFYAPF